MRAQVGDAVAGARRRQDHLRIGGDMLAQALERRRRSARSGRPPSLRRPWSARPRTRRRRRRARASSHDRSLSGHAGRRRARTRARAMDGRADSRAQVRPRMLTSTLRPPRIRSRAYRPDARVPLRSKKMSSCVRPGVRDVRASAARPVSALTSEDLPTFERPAKAISGAPTGGKPSARAAAKMNSHGPANSLRPASVQSAATVASLIRSASSLGSSSWGTA